MHCCRVPSCILDCVARQVAPLELQFTCHHFSSAQLITQTSASHFPCWNVQSQCRTLFEALRAKIISNNSVLHTSLSNLDQMMIILMPVMKFHAISIASRNALALVHFMQRFTAADELFVNLCDNKAVSKVARVTTDGESDPGETGGVLLGLGSCPITPQS